MTDKLKVDIFGVKSEPVPGGCGCNGGCGPQPTMGELFNELVDFINDSDLAAKVELNFIDVNETDMDNYPEAKKSLDNELPIPLTTINGKPTMYGGINKELIYRKVKKAI
ncbi:hypothetical protein [Natranaerobius trueperi]|uniref:Arsenical resistance operon transcriptional repressor ArsD n=1 Tax=Natranaerobius trueperi TaxID=759412 RepID=A0A226BUV7_9FIRM|nr:hypothetical protein [Natranaerobius trueperi]OWZ82786.1 hypothetical protein CDO51_12275 [Natranaerobius trueperi]